MTQSKNSYIHQAITILKEDPKLQATFFMRINSVDWLDPLIKNSLLEQSTTLNFEVSKDGNNSSWPQLEYLKSLCSQAQNGQISGDHIKKILSILRGIEYVGNNLYISHNLFKAIFQIPISYLTKKDIQKAFSWINQDGQFTEIIVSQVFFEIIKDLSDTTNNLKVLDSYIENLFSVTSVSGEDPRLRFFSDFHLSEFREHIKDTSLPILNLIVSNAYEALNKILSKQLDSRSFILRPAVESHTQNNHHDSALSHLVDIFFSSSSELLSKDFKDFDIKKLRTSKKWTFRRIFLALSTSNPKKIDLDEVAKTLLSWGLRSEIRHEAFHFLQMHFDVLSKTNQRNFLKTIASLEIKKDIRYRAWQQLRWLMALKDSASKEATAMRKAYLKITNQKEPENPDFDGYISVGWTGPTSPLSAEEMSDLTSIELYAFLISFQEEDNIFDRGPSRDGLTRTFEEFVSKNSLKGSELLGVLRDLACDQQVALLRGLLTAWTNKQYFSAKDIIGAIESIISEKSPSYLNEENFDPRLISTVCDIIIAGTNDDKNAFNNRHNPALERILKLLLANTKQDQHYDTFPDGYARAINEPRGKVFEAYIVFTLRMARHAQKRKIVPERTSRSLIASIDHLINSSNPNELSLYSLLGRYYRQFLYLNQNWTLKTLFPRIPKEDHQEVWEAFFDGFSYVATYVRDSYIFFRDRGDLIRYLRHKGADKSSTKLNSLQNRIIELATFSFLEGDETLERGLIKDLVESEQPLEWQQISWTAYSFLKDSENHVHKLRTLSIIRTMLEKAPWKTNSLSWKAFYSSIVRVLDLLDDENYELISHFFSSLPTLAEASWDLHGQIDFLHRIKDSAPETAAKLFLALLASAKNPPTYPEEKIADIFSSLKMRGRRTELKAIYNYYAELPLPPGPIANFAP